MNLETRQSNAKFYILLVFLLITIALLRAVIIYYYLIKYWVEQKPLLPFCDKINGLKQVLHRLITSKV